MRTGIITAPRPRSTLVESIESYRRAGFTNDVRVFAEPGVSPVIDDKVFHVQNDERLGNLRNWHSALSALALDVRGGDDWILLCEDDISWARDAATLLSEALEELRGMHKLYRQAGALSLYFPRRHTQRYPGRLKPGWHAHNAGAGTWGFQAMMFNQSQATELLRDGQFNAILANPALDKNIDKFVGKCLLDRNKTILYRVPCLVDHDLGDGNSSLGYPEVRPNLKTDYFAGPRA